MLQALGVRRLSAPVLLAVTAAATVLPACSTRDEDAVRIGHANIAGWAIYEGSLDAGRDLAEVVERRSLDAVGVSEACESQIVAAVDALGESTFDYVFQETTNSDSPLPWSPPPESGCRYGNALLVSSELDLTDSWAVELPTADRTSQTEFDPEEDRWAICGTVDLGTAATLCATHLTNLQAAPDTRRRQAVALHDALDARADSESVAVIVGDFNARRGSSELGPFAQWDDASRSRGVLHVFVRGLDFGSSGAAAVGRADHDLRWGSVRPTGRR